MKENEKKLSERHRVAANNFVYRSMSKKESLLKAGFGPAYVRKCASDIFNTPHMKFHIEELRRKRDEAVQDLWKNMLYDAPVIYEQYKKLAENTPSDDVKRRIYSDILNRTGYIGANKLEISEGRQNTENIDRDIGDILGKLKSEGVDVSRYTHGNEDDES